MKRFLNKYLILILFGALAGVTVAALVAPSMLEWWNNPSIPTPVNCSPFVRWGAERMMMVQAVGAAAGAVVFIFLGFAFRGRKKPAPAPQPGKLPEPTIARESELKLPPRS